MHSKKELKEKIVVTGGGSGGHLSAAEAITKEISSRYDITSKNFLYIGGDLGMEGEKIGSSIEQKRFRNASFNCKYIRAGKLQRSFSLNTISLLFRTFLGFYDSYKILKKFKPDIVISTGGFVSVPVCIVAKLLKADIYLHEQTSTVGLSNKIVGKFSKKIFLAYESSAQFFKKKKTVHVGNLVREDVLETKGSGKVVQALKKMIVNQEEYPIVYISGGSLGSHILNDTVRSALHNLLNKYQIIVQTGDNRVYQDYDKLVKEKITLDNHLKDRFFPVKYVESKEIGFLYDNIDLFVGRAGANTVYEVGVLKLPSIFIPIPWVTHNEQYENAKVLKNFGLSEILPEGELTPENLVVKIDRYLSKERNVDMRALKKAFPLDAAKKILQQIDFS